MTKVKIAKLQVILSVLFAVLCKPLSAQGPGQQIPAEFYTGNVWYFEWAAVTNTFAIRIDTIIDRIAESGIKFARIGASARLSCLNIPGTRIPM
jgi:hypothetical protein